MHYPYTYNKIYLERIIGQVWRGKSISPYTMLLKVYVFVCIAESIAKWKLLCAAKVYWISGGMKPRNLHLYNKLGDSDVTESSILPQGNNQAKLDY